VSDGRKAPVNTPASGIPAGGPGHGSARGYRWEPFALENTAHLHHGARSARTVAPIADQLAEKLITDAPWTAASAFWHTIRAWAWAEAQASLLRAWLDEHGLVSEDGRPRAGTYELNRVENRLIRLRQELGLSPQSLGQLLARAASVARAVGDEQALAALEAEGRRILAARAAQDGSPLDGSSRPALGPGEGPRDVSAVSGEDS
jgi:hypothetical protein